MRKNTGDEYIAIIKDCKEIFEKKSKDYGTAWCILRPASLTDQIYIKAKRIRAVQEKGTQKIDDNIEGEFVGIINYGIMAIIQLEMSSDHALEIPYNVLSPKYDEIANKTKHLLETKNHDYDEAWRDMRVSSMTDIILMKLLRTKQIEDNKGKTLISEGVVSNYQDIINYAVFCLILLKTK